MLAGFAIKEVDEGGNEGSRHIPSSKSPVVALIWVGQLGAVG